MFHSLDRIDWELLHKQKLVLLGVLDSMDRDTPVAEALWGLVHLLDALQDDAVEAGRWAFREETGDAAATEPPPRKRYYMEDDDGHHYGPLDDYEEAAGVADAIHGRIIAPDGDRPSPAAEEDSAAGGA